MATIPIEIFKNALLEKEKLPGKKNLLDFCSFLNPSKTWHWTDELNNSWNFIHTSLLKSQPIDVEKKIAKSPFSERLNDKLPYPSHPFGQANLGDQTPMVTWDLSFP